MILERAFYEGSTIAVARGLLGTFLEVTTPEGRSIGRIVETEAYLARGDAANHAHRGKTPGNATMFGPPGRAHVFFIYGRYHCFNVVTRNPGQGEAVLIRALEPVEGLELMRRRRRTDRPRDLCSGPGKLTMALGITGEHDGLDLRDGPVRILDRGSFPERFPPAGRLPIVRTTRVGISRAVELPLRFYIRDSEFVSVR